MKVRERTGQRDQFLGHHERRSNIINTITSKIIKGLGVSAAAAATMAISFAGTTLPASASVGADGCHNDAGFFSKMTSSTVKYVEDGSKDEIRILNQDRNANGFLCVKPMAAETAGGVGPFVQGGFVAVDDKIPGPELVIEETSTV